MAPVHPFVPKIADAIREAGKPQTILQIASLTGVTGQTVRNHIKAALDNAYVVLYPIKDGKAHLYDVPGSKQTIYPVIQWGEDKKEIRELFNDWGRKGLPNNQNASSVARIICKLYELALAFTYDRDNTDMNYQTKLVLMKELKQRLNRIREHHRDIVAICNSLSELDIWDPKTVAKELIIKDEDITPEKINSTLDNLQLLIKKENP